MEQLAALANRLDQLNTRVDTLDTGMQRALTSVVEDTQSDLAAAYSDALAREERINLGVRLLRDQDTATRERLDVLERQIGLDPSQMDIGRTVISRLAEVEERPVYNPRLAEAVEQRVADQRNEIRELTTAVATQGTNIATVGRAVATHNANWERLGTQLPAVVSRLEIAEEETKVALARSQSASETADGARRLVMERLSEMGLEPIEGTNKRVREITASRARPAITFGERRAIEPLSFNLQELVTPPATGSSFDNTIDEDERSDDGETMGN